MLLLSHNNSPSAGRRAEKPLLFLTKSLWKLRSSNGSCGHPLPPLLKAVSAGQVTHPQGCLSSSWSTVWSQYSKTRCSFLFLLKTSSRFTRLGCFSCCNTVGGLVSYCMAGGGFGEKRGMRCLHPPGSQFLELKPFCRSTAQREEAARLQHNSRCCCFRN